MDQFRVEEEMARLVRDNEAAWAGVEALRRQLVEAQEKLVRFPLPRPPALLRLTRAIGGQGQ